MGCTVWEPQNIRNFAESGFFFLNYVLQERSILISTYARKKKRFFPEKAFFSICFDNICFWIESTVSVHSFDVTTLVVIVAPISPDQSERSKISLDQSESRI